MQKPNTRNYFVVSQILLLIIFSITSMAVDPSSEEATVHIVYTEQPDALIQAEDHHIKTLTSVFESEDAAKEALLYVYKTAACGFSVKLTAAQVEKLSKQPGVLQVVRSQTLHLHSGHGIGKMNV